MSSIRLVGMALRFEVLARYKRARASKMTLPHYECYTPMFMPVGTQGTVKGLTPQQLEELQCQVVLGNTYHLGNRPGPDLLHLMGGLHSFMNWPRGLLTDSGGFQMNKIGADIIMALDDVVSSLVTGPRIEEAMHRTVRWIDRCIAGDRKGAGFWAAGWWRAGMRAGPAGGACLCRYAIGGLAGGEDKECFWRVVAQCAAGLPDDKPRYVMGVGYPLDIVVCSALGADMYDCVYPTRTARFGTALVPQARATCHSLPAATCHGVLKLKQAAMASDFRPIDPDCSCMVCKRYTRAYLHSLVTRDPVGAHLVSYHNIAHMMQVGARRLLTLQLPPPPVSNFCWPPYIRMVHTEKV
eukprot:jgi/Mesen1/1866/ME000143S00917